MIVHKVLKYLVLLLSVITAVFFIYTISQGDDAIKIDEGGIQSSTVTPLMYLAYIMLAVIVAAVLVFLVANLARNPEALKKAGISVGLVLVVCAIAYFGFADGSDAANNSIELDDGEYLTEANSKIIGGAIYTFYIMAFLAVASIVWSGVSKLIKK
jgi:preprotein translocase subunit SecY